MRLAGLLLLIQQNSKIRGESCARTSGWERNKEVVGHGGQQERGRFRSVKLSRERRRKRERERERERESKRDSTSTTRVGKRE